MRRGVIGCPGCQGRQAGYNMVMLVIAITLLNIAVAAALPMWSHMIQRDKEEELVSRGWQYVEAIRVFQNRFSRKPVRLEELIEVKPRCIRRLWKDPITDGKFVPIFENQGQPLVAQTPDGQQMPVGPDGKPVAPPDSDPGIEGPDDGGFNPLGGKNPEEVAVGPITGVRSRSNKKSILVFFGKEKYDQWQFTLDALLGGGRPVPGAGGPGGGGPGVPPPNMPPGAGGPAPGSGINLSTRWLGRPLPSVFSPPAGNLPGDGDQQPSDGRGFGNPPGRDPRGKPPANGQLPRKDAFQ
jgi:type II secretory pathway pseudopilin PulG